MSREPEPREEHDEHEEHDALERALLALPREIEAPPTLWTGIEARIAAKRRRRVVVLRRGMTGAAVLLAAAAVILFLRAPKAPIEVGRTPAPARSEALAVVPPPPASPEMLVPEEASYVAALASLEATLHERQKELPAKDAARVGASLRAIDVAISTTRASLVDHPGDPDLRAELDAEYEQKIDAMNDVLEWTTRS